MTVAFLPRALAAATALVLGLPGHPGTIGPVGASFAVRASEQCVQASSTIDPSIPWPQELLQPERAWSFSTGANVLVAVVDSGVDGNTPQLAGRVEPGVDLLARGGPANTDCLGHGTFVAGIIAAAPAWGIGFTGVAPDARILPIRATSNMAGDPELFAQGIRAAVDAGAKIINVSASTTTPYPALVDAVAYAESHDVLVIASAGGDANSDAPVYPAALPTVLAVTAVDRNGDPGSFSRPASYIGLAAPGVEVTSIGPGGPGLFVGSGTSYAVAFVTGVAALVRAYRPGLTAEQVRHRLLVTADHAAEVPDPWVGWGIVDPVAALTTVLPEEGPGAVVIQAQPQPIDVVPPPPARPGRVLVLLGAGVMVLVAGLAGLLAVLGPAGHRRRWRPARVLRVTGDSNPPQP